MGDKATEPDLISLFLGLAFFFHALATAFEFFNVLGKLIGMESLGYYTRFIMRMLARMMNWLIVFSILLLVFSLSMWILYPFVPQFETLPDAIISLWILATTGEPIEGFPPREVDWYAWTTPWPSYGMLGSLNGIAFLIL
jgi:hypothetical protein